MSDHKTNILHADHPNVGDLWEEMCTPIARILAVSEDWVLLHKLAGRTHETKPVAMTRRRFAQWIRYSTISDKTWADVHPRYFARMARSKGIDT